MNLPISHRGHSGSVEKAKPGKEGITMWKLQKGNGYETCGESKKTLRWVAAGWICQRRHYLVEVQESSYTAVNTRHIFKLKGKYLVIYKESLSEGFQAGVLDSQYSFPKNGKSQC